MTLPQVYDLFDYWADHPPVPEIGEILLRVYTTWKGRDKPQPEAEHQKSLEDRWAAGAMNAKQLFEATGGRISTGAASGHPFEKAIVAGVGPLPGINPVRDKAGHTIGYTGIDGA
jgi:hypothetical protein